MNDNDDKQEKGGGYLEKQASEDKSAPQPTNSGKTEITTPGKRTYDLVIDGVAYLVQSTPFSFNEETRFYVSVDNGQDHVFTWDLELKGFRAIDDESVTIPGYT